MRHFTGTSGSRITLEMFRPHVNRLTPIAVNFGPQHPAAHGVLRLILELNGEVCLPS